MEMINVRENGNKVENISIGKILSKYNRFIYKICFRWYPNFSFDRSLTAEDLAQEFKLKLLKDLHKYNYEKGEIVHYISRMARNFFITKKVKMLTKGLHPVNSEGKFFTMQSILDGPNGYGFSENELTFLETIDSGEDTQEFELAYNQFIDLIKKELNRVKYKPNKFFKRTRTFSRLIFDTLLEQDHRFLDYILFDYRCRVRYSKATDNVQMPEITTPNAKTIARYIGVDVRTVHRAFKIIRQVILKCAFSENNGNCEIGGSIDGKSRKKSYQAPQTRNK